MKRLLVALETTCVVAAVLVPLTPGSAFAAKRPPPPATWTCTTGWVALTFDDGPDVNNTQPIVSTLAQYGVHATFFEVGENVAGHADLTAAVYAAGNRVGNHSYTHADFTTLTSTQIADELQQTTAAIAAASAPDPTLYRPPYGATNAAVKAVANELGMSEVLWTVDPQDWSSSSSTKSIVRVVTRGLHAGDIVLLHDGYTKHTVAALPQILDSMRAQGLCPGFIEATTVSGPVSVVADPAVH